MSDDVRILSRRLYGILEKVGASETIRQLAREVAVKNEINGTIYLRQYIETETASTLNCGSMYEGTFTNGLLSDTDTLFIKNHLMISLKADVDNIALIIRDEDMFPGYVRQQFVQNGCPVTIDGWIRIDRNTLDIDNQGRVCLKHPTIVNKKGPANQVMDASGRHVGDRVIAIRCKGIPDFAEEWVTRNRHYGWPSQQQVNEMKEMGCMVVCVGHESSGKSDIDYRLSFTRQERLLMSNLNPVQHKVYILFKMINADLIQPEVEHKVLTSYHLKTCVLHMAENTPESIWREDNIVNCVLLCLKTLCLWIDIKFCPNYFLKDQNLFRTRDFRSNRNKLLCQINNLLEVGDKLFLQIRKEDIGMMLTDEGYKRKSGFREKIRLKLVFKVLSQCLIRPWFAIGKMQSLRILHTLVEELKNTKTLPDHTEEETQSAITALVPWLNLYIAKSFVCGAFGMQTAQDRLIAFEKADYYFKQATPTDLIQTQLIVASYMYRACMFEECESLLTQIENEIGSNAVAVCCCSGKFHLYSKTDEWDDKVVTLSPQEISKRMTQCIFFLPIHREITPEPLRLEMERCRGTSHSPRDKILEYWFDFAVVDAVVFLYFMQFMVSVELNRPKQTYLAMYNLIRTTQDDLGHKETAFNLLGWIFKRENQVGTALHYFAMSWSIRPYHNAAKFHINDLSDNLRCIVNAWKQSRQTYQNSH